MVFVLSLLSCGICCSLMLSLMLLECCSLKKVWMCKRKMMHGQHSKSNGCVFSKAWIVLLGALSSSDKWFTWQCIKKMKCICDSQWTRHGSIGRSSQSNAQVSSQTSAKVENLELRLQSVSLKEQERVKSKKSVCRLHWPSSWIPSSSCLRSCGSKCDHWKDNRSQSTTLGANWTCSETMWIKLTCS